jgi:hypothetical protein
MMSVIYLSRGTSFRVITVGPFFEALVSCDAVRHEVFGGFAQFDVADTGGRGEEREESVEKKRKRKYYRKRPSEGGREGMIRRLHMGNEIR